MRRVHEGLGILLKYLEGYQASLQAEHDELWCSGPSETELTPEDAKRLDELGFHFDEAMDSWHKFV